MQKPVLEQRKATANQLVAEVLGSMLPNLLNPFGFLG
jgi:hypothetical protein